MNDSSKYKLPPSVAMRRMSATLGTATKVLVNAGPTVLLAVNALNSEAAVRYFQTFDKATAPAATDVPNRVIRVGASGGIAISTNVGVPACGILFPTGLGVAWSTTRETFTDAATAANLTISVAYVPYEATMGTGELLDVPAGLQATSIAQVESVAFAGRALMLGCAFLNESGGTLFAQLHDTNTAIVAGAAPVGFLTAVNTGQSGNLIGIPPGGMVFENGISFGWSSTRDTYTAAGAGTGLFVTVDYRPL